MQYMFKVYRTSEHHRPTAARSFVRCTAAMHALMQGMHDARFPAPPVPVRTAQQEKSLGDSSMIRSADNMIMSADNMIISADNMIMSADNMIISADNMIISADNMIISADNMIMSADNNALSAVDKILLSDNNVLSADNNAIAPLGPVVPAHRIRGPDARPRAGQRPLPKACRIH
jgi:lipopolysaccharide assembly outer membrane protein LptD (OstA)